MRSLDSQLDALRENSLFRELHTLDSPQTTNIVVDGQPLLNFSSNDYLGLANAPQLRDAFHRAIDAHGVGAAASRLVSGSLAPHRDLEQSLAAFKQTEAALSFSSGYAAALGTLGAFLEKGDIVILDKLSHASLIDGARLSGAKVRVFPHNHLSKLEKLLQWASTNTTPENRILVVTESVFSMDGDRTPLAEIVELKNRHNALLLLDEAHAVGVLGPAGRGLADELGLASDIDIAMGTLSKAAGVSGGYVCGSHELIQLLVNRARSFIYSTAPPPAVAATAAASVRLLQSPEGGRLRDKLWHNIRLLHESLAATTPGLDLELPEPSSAILPLILHGEQRALDLSASLRERGFLVPAIRYPTVARDSARLRITLSAAHTESQVDALVAAIRSALSAA